MTHRIQGAARLAAMLLLVPTPVTAQQPETHQTDEGVFHVAALSELQLTEGTLPTARPRFGSEFTARASLDGPGEAFILGWSSDRDPSWPNWSNIDVPTQEALIAIRLAQPRSVQGRLFLPTEDGVGVVVGYSVDASAFSADERPAFLAAAHRYHGERMDAEIAGGAWWRHRHEQASVASGDKTPEEDEQAARFINPRRRSTVEDSFSLFSGGRAVAENLQLDRLLPATPVEAADVPIDTIDGITTPEYDWSALTAGLAPDTDPLAGRIPHDQHAIFFPSFDALAAMTDHANELGSPILDVFDESTKDARSRQRTEEQLGLPMTALARILGPKVIRSIAITGSDPYLRTGTDIALMFEAVNVKWLHSLISSRMGTAMMKDSRSKRYLHAVRQIPYARHYTPDRKLDAYVAAIDDMVVVTNSLQQLERLVEVWEGKRESLASLPEYTFFRDRYPRGAEGETALLVLSDATIRRWCSPRWRIGSSRRVRAAAALADIQADLVDEPVATNQLLSGPPPGLGDVLLTPDGPRCGDYGSPFFLTPIVELDLASVTETEADLYARWREGYQRNWTGVFDPIAVRFDVGEDSLALDVTVRPLIAASEYQGMIEMASGSEIEPGAGDPHDALLHWTMALDASSTWLGREAAMLKMLFPQMDPLAWVGNSVSFFVDDTPFWDDYIAAEDDAQFFFDNLHRLPLALHAEVRNSVLLASFLVGVRAMVEQSAPGMMLWENNTWNEEPYVSMNPSDAARDEGLPDQGSIHYVASGQGLTVTSSEELLQRAIDRRVARNAATDEATPDEPLGRHVTVSMTGRLIELFESMAYSREHNGLRRSSFGNLPILNEWKRLRPDEDPVAFHERVWHERLLCTGGGEYVWNEEWQTMESTVYGHPLAPRAGPQLPAALHRIASGAAGLTFEEDGLRARVELLFKPR
jgi:hypothetical protein